MAFHQLNEGGLQYGHHQVRGTRFGGYGDDAGVLNGSAERVRHTARKLQQLVGQFRVTGHSRCCAITKDSKGVVGRVESFAYSSTLERSVAMKCRAGCGACCIAPSISSPIPGMPNGKAAGERCLHLTEEYLCGIFGRPERPSVCAAFQAEGAVCGDSRDEAIQLLGWLEQATA